MRLPIKRGLDRVPGGMMLVPLGLDAVLHTLAPGTPTLFGSFTGALFTGAPPILAVFYVCMGSTIELRAPGVVAALNDANGGLYMALMGRFGRPQEAPAA